MKVNTIVAGRYQQRAKVVTPPDYAPLYGGIECATAFSADAVGYIGEAIAHHAFVNVSVAGHNGAGPPLWEGPLQVMP